MSANFDQLEVLCLEEEFDFICLTETHLTDDLSDAEFMLKNYNVFRCNSTSRHTGGVCFYIKKNWKAKIIECTGIDKQIWWLTIKIQNKSMKYIIIGIYRSPDPQQSPEGNFIKFFEDEMEKFNGNDMYLIMGDLNIDWLKNTSNKIKLQEIIDDNFLQQIVNKPTRITSRTSTLIDYVVTNIRNINAEPNLSMKISDHESLEITIPIKREIDLHKNKLIKTMNFNNVEFRNNLMYGDIYNVTSNHSCNEISNITVNSINDALKPMISIRNTTSRLSNQWYNNQLKRLKEMKVQFYQVAVWHNNEFHWSNYKRIRNQYRSELSKAKNNFISNKISSCFDQKSMWKTVKELVLKKDSSNVQEIYINGRFVTNEQEIANELNSFFVRSVDQIVNSIPFVRYENLIQVNAQLNFKFERIDGCTLKNTLKKINNKKDQNFLTIKMLLDNYDIVGNYLHAIVESSLQSGTFPDCLKESYIVPIQKIKNTVDPNEIRPVNMLMTISKVLEKVVYFQLNKYFEHNNLLNETQSGFRQQHSCESLLNLVVTQWKTEITNKKCVVAVFLDLKRAFETVNRGILLQKLLKYGIKDVELKWFSSYLENRTQRSKCGQYISTSEDVTIGVPQGAVLGTLLFLIYINDLEKVLKKSKVCMFADDALIYISGRNPEECVRTINSELEEVVMYLNMNKLKLNTNKTKAMIINGETDGNIVINGVTIEQVEEIKYLGVIIDKNLKFDLHYKYICKKISKKIGFLRRIRKKISTLTAINIYNTTVKPHFEYCSTLLFLGSQEMKIRLQKLQNKGMRCILREHRLSHQSDMLQKLQWLSVNQRLVMNVLVCIFKMKNGMLPNYMQKQLKYVAEVQPYNLRNVGDFRLDFCRTKFCQNLLFYNGLKIYNRLPLELKTENNYYIFKREIVAHIKRFY